MATIREARHPGMAFDRQRSAHGMPIAELARRTHIPYQRLHRILRGDSVPTPEETAALQGVLPLQRSRASSAAEDGGES